MTDEKDPPAPRWPPAERNAGIELIAARAHVEDIVEDIRAKIYRYLEMEVLATQQDDHTKSLSERVTTLERELGSLRDSWSWYQREFDAQRKDRDLARRPWRYRLAGWLYLVVSGRRDE